MESVVNEGHTLQGELELYQDPSGDTGCLRCGKCCAISSKRVISLNKSDIRRIEQVTRLNEDEFSEIHNYHGYAKTLKANRDPLTGLSLCMFFGRGDDGVGYCSIHDELYNGARTMPDMCHNYPFGKKCRNGRVIQVGRFETLMSKIMYWI